MDFSGKKQCVKKAQRGVDDHFLCSHQYPAPIACMAACWEALFAHPGTMG